MAGGAGVILGLLLLGGQPQAQAEGDSVYVRTPPPATKAAARPAERGTYISESCSALGLSAKAYLVYDLDTSRPVAMYNLERQQPIASLTKLMTAILAEERLRFDGSYQLTESERKTFGVDRMRADKMLEMALIPSNNAVCKVIARLVSGSESAFAQLMNQRARELGLRATHFVNASGLPGEGQYSCLYDVALLGRTALTYPHISAAMSKPNVELGGTTYKGTLNALYQRHGQSSTGKLRAGKTGYTKAAGRCLCLLYESGGHRYLVVTLGSSGVKASFRDAEQLLAKCGLYNGAVGEWK